MPVGHDDDGEVKIPHWVTNRQAFRQWVHSPAVPEKLQVNWIAGEIWMDLSPQQIFTHVALRGEIIRAMANLVLESDLGHIYSNGVFYSNDDADISINPDGLFISYETLKAKRVKFVHEEDGDYSELEGSPDMVLEVVSDRSAHKDMQVLLKAYWKAGIKEYWLVDGRQSPATLNVYQHGKRRYVASRCREGWINSVVFDHQFRLLEGLSRIGEPDYTLEVK